MSAPPLYGRTALVAGGASPAARETALGLAKLGASVTLAVADEARGMEAAEAIRCQSGNPDVSVLPAELSTRDGVRALAERFAAREGRLDLLVNHGAVLSASRGETADGVERTLVSAHLAPALLTHLLLPLLREGAPSRIVSVTSGAHRWARVRWDDLHSARGYRGWDAYARAALLNLSWTHELARRVRGTGITVVAADGGAWGGDADAVTPEMLPPGMRAVWPLLRRLGRRSAEAAARGAVVAATSRDVASGAYLDVRGRPARASRAAHDGELSLRAWEVTAELLGLDAGALGGVRARRSRKTAEVPVFEAGRLAAAAV